MSAKLDKFFQQKLTEHTMTPSPGAWEKVEAGLTKKNDGLVWFRWAAVLLIPILLAGVLVLRRSADHSEKITALHTEKNKKDSTAKTIEDNKAPAYRKKENVQTPQLKSSPAKQETRHTVLPQRSKQLINVPLENMTAVTEDQKTNEGMEAARQHPAVENIVETTGANPTATLAVVAETSVTAAPKEKPITLEYTLQSSEPETPVEKGITLTMELKEKSRFQKVFDFARDAKNSEGPLAVLRQAKQELFALNLKKDKHPK